MIFQLSENDVERSSTLSRKDIGKWCFLIQGCYHGFYKTSEDAELAWQQINR